MIDREFWRKVASEWSTESDGLDGIPDTKMIPDDLGQEDLGQDNIDLIDGELADILAGIEI